MKVNNPVKHSLLLYKFRKRSNLPMFLVQYFSNINGNVNIAITPDDKGSIFRIKKAEQQTDFIKWL